MHFSRSPLISINHVKDDTIFVIIKLIKPRLENLILIFRAFQLGHFLME